MTGSHDDKKVLGKASSLDKEKGSSHEYQEAPFKGGETYLADEEPLKESSLFDHVADLRRRLLWCVSFFLICFIAIFPFSHHIFQWILWPLEPYLGHSPEVIYTVLYEQFFVNVRLSLWLALLISMPWFFCQLWIFMAPALYKKERTFMIVLCVLTPVLFLLGIVFVFFVVIPNAWHFFASFQNFSSRIHVVLVPKVSEYLSLILHLVMAFGMAFEIPVAMLLLVRSGFVSVSSLKKMRRYAFLGAFVIAAVVTPPDPLSQVFMALPLYILYEMGVFLSRLLHHDER